MSCDKIDISKLLPKKERKNIHKGFETCTNIYMSSKIQVITKMFQKKVK